MQGGAPDGLWAGRWRVETECSGRGHMARPPWSCGSQGEQCGLRGLGFIGHRVTPGVKTGQCWRGGVLGSPAVPGARPRPESQCQRVTTPLPHPGRDSLAGRSHCPRERPGGKSQGCAARSPVGGMGSAGTGPQTHATFPDSDPRPSPCQPTDQRGFWGSDRTFV